EVEKHGTDTVVRFTSSSLDTATATFIGGQLPHILGESDLKMRLDLTNVNFMTAGAMGELVGLHRRMRKQGGELTVCNVHQPIYEIFRVVRLTELLDIHRFRC